MDPDQTAHGYHCLSKRLLQMINADDFYCDWRWKVEFHILYSFFLSFFLSSELTPSKGHQDKIL